MSLHPLQPIVLSSDNTYLIAPGNLAFGSFPMDPNQTVGFRAIHNAKTQDASIRCWLSPSVGGPNIAPWHLVQANWHPDRSSTFEIVLYTSEAPILNPFLTSYTVKVDPGAYYFNALNLVLAPNSFYLTMRVGEVDVD